MKNFTPFADSSAVVTITSGDENEFTIENGTDNISMYGDLTIAKDAKGKEKAQRLAELFTKMANAI